jgi:hypothetical protein
MCYTQEVEALGSACIDNRYCTMSVLPSRHALISSVHPYAYDLKTIQIVIGTSSTCPILLISAVVSMPFVVAI